MKLHPWFRFVWWALLTAGLTWLLAPRFGALRAGQGSPADVFLTLVWVALALAPVFSELEFFGLKFKAQIEELKKTVREETDAIRSDVRTAIDLRNQFNPSIVFPQPASDVQLSELREMIRSELASRPSSVLPAGSADAFVLDAKVSEMFAVRYTLERELRRIEGHRLASGAAIMRPATVPQIIRWLVDQQLLPPDVGTALREIYVVCSNSIHGNSPNEQQLAFVRDVAPGVLAKLKEIDSAEHVT